MLVIMLKISSRNANTDLFLPKRFINSLIIFYIENEEVWCYSAGFTFLLKTYYSLYNEMGLLYTNKYFIYARIKSNAGSFI